MVDAGDGATGFQQVDRGPVVFSGLSTMTFVARVSRYRLAP